MSDIKHFLSPRLTGKRFVDHTVPVEILQDFAALQELIVDLAKKIYLDENPSRKRVPKGFTDGITLNLHNVEEGSAILNLFLGTALAASPILGEDAHAYTYFEKAKNQIIEVVSAAEKGDNVRDILTVKHLSFFNRIGRSLKEDEVIEINPKAPHIARLNKVTRHRIVQSLSEDASYTDNFDLVAPIASINVANKLFAILLDGQEISAKLDPVNYRIIVSTLNDFYSQQFVAIKGEGIYNRNSKLTKIISIASLDVLDPLDVSLRINEIANLKDGWYNAVGKAPNPTNLWKFEQLFKQCYSEKLPLPTIFPTMEGNIQLEWSIKSYEISLEVDLETFISDFIAINIDSDHIDELQINLNDQEDWNVLSEYFTQYSQN